MKKLKVTITSVACGLTLLAGASTVSADPIAIVVTPQNPNQLVGSDTLNQVMDLVIAGLPLAQINLYSGLGSSQGERQLEGSPNSGEPTCTPNDGNGAPEANPGCQEISGMSRQMGNRVCEDDADDPGDPNDSTTVNDTAEGLAICKDGIVVVAHNIDHSQFGTAAGCAETTPPPASPNPVYNHANYDETGILRNSGTLPMSSINPALPDYVISDWKDVLRLIYTGCRNDQGTCSAVGRTQRCSAANNPVRAALIDRWNWIVESGAIAGDSLGASPAQDCSGTNRCTGLRKAYRRDDTSGTTGVFLELLSLQFAINPALTGRTRFIPTLGGTNFPAIPETHLFCDGGENEGFVPGPDGVRGDPIAKPCRAEDDICGPNGQMGVVRAIRTPRVGGFPQVQCRRGSFGLRPWMVTSLPSCPDGTVSTVPGACFAPFFPQDRNGDGDTTDPPTETFVGDRNYDCLNDVNSRPIDVPGTTDGRSYNFVWRDIDGNRMDITTGVLPQTASWRENQGALDVVLPVLGGPFPAVCAESDATRQLGCLVANTQCTIAFGGRETAGQDPYDGLQEAFILNEKVVSDANIFDLSYPFQRDLFMNAIGGFENLWDDCKARGGTDAYCNDEFLIANEFYNMGPVATSACQTAGYIPAASSVCIGATAAAGCGAPTVQPKEACLPQGPPAP